MSGKKVGEIQLDKKIFGREVNTGLLHQTSLMYQARRRSGTASTKTQKEVRGGGKKPWRQKGTGRARAGSIRSPLWRGGGVVFGPHPRDYSYSMPAQTKTLAIKSALTAKLADGRIQVVDKIELKEPKTKLFKSVLISLKVKDSALVISASIDRNIKMASRNLEGVMVKTAGDFNAMDILRHENLVITEAALKNLSSRL